jgi:hypothetical protein
LKKLVGDSAIECWCIHPGICSPAMTYATSNRSYRTWVSTAVGWMVSLDPLLMPLFESSKGASEPGLMACADQTHSAHFVD